MTGLTDRLALDGDDRGVSEVIGSILVFGLLVAMLTLVQTQLIPQANEEVEFEHSRDVESDFAELQTQMHRAVSTGAASSSTVTLGMTYPPRLLFFNPTPPRGTLRTTDPGLVRIANIQSSSSAGVFLNTQPAFTYESRHLNYSVDYNRYDGPMLTREAAAVYKAEDGAKLVRGTSLIADDRISLRLVGGDLAAGGITAEEVEVKALSAPARTYKVSDNGAPIEITVPTNIPESTWRDQLAQERVSAGGHVQGIDYTTNANAPNELTVTLEPGEDYMLSMGKVGFGNGGDPEAKYMVRTELAEAGAAIDVRDRMNNPVSGVTVTASVSSGTITSGSATGSSIPVTTGPDGVASVEVASGSPTSVHFRGDLDDDGTVESIEETTAFFIGGVFLEDVRAFPGNDHLELTLTNAGASREIVRVQLGHATEFHSKLALEEVLLIGGGITGNLTSTSTEVTNVSDGPDEITGIGIGAIESVSAIENERPAAPDNPVTVPSGTNTLEIQLDKNYELSGHDHMAVRVTVYFQNGESETYDLMLDSEDTSP